MAKESVVARIRESIRETVAAEGCELVHVEYLPEGMGSMVRLYIDKENGVNLDDCQRVSRKVGILLDVEDLISHKYTLEVSSPGLERPLFEERDYERFTGREIRLVTRTKIENRHKFKGLLKGIASGTIELECDEGIYRIPVGLVKKANLVHRF